MRPSERDKKKAERALDLALRVLGGELPSSPSNRPGAQAVVQLQRRLTSEQTHLIAAQYRAGKSTYELAADWQINRATVTKALKRAGEPIRRPTLSEEQLLEAARLQEEGWSLIRLGKKYYVDPKTLKKRLSGLPKTFSY